MQTGARMEKNSRKLIARLNAENFVLKSVNGSHHKFFRASDKRVVVVPHPKKDLPIGTVKDIYKDAGWTR
jgi:predicted RNA binding protein YcfA (HicA-like mRNA interferase family)